MVHSIEISKGENCQPKFGSLATNGQNAFSHSDHKVERVSIPTLGPSLQKVLNDCCRSY